MRLRLSDRGERSERGAIAILTALLAVVVLAVAALGVDITTQVNERQKLHDTVDAAALAGAYQLPSNGAQAKLDALAFAAKNDPDAPPPVVVTLCVVGSIFNASSGLYEVDTSQISATCNRSAGTSITGFKCNERICSLPCDGAADRCNVIRVVGNKPVPFSFAPAIGINQGSTGSVTSAACKGACGTAPLNPMDVVVVADRTSSMNVGGHDYDIDLRDGVLGMLSKMTPSQQYVALGTIGRSFTTTHSTLTCNSISKGLSYPSSDNSGAWVPVNFSKDYLNADKTVKVTDPLVKGINCLTTHSSTGTHLASPMKAAARYLLGPSSPFDTSSNINSLPARTGTIRKAIIFETDGAPNESSFAGTVALNNAVDIGSTNEDTACSYFSQVAANARAAGILVVTVGFNLKKTDTVPNPDIDYPVRCDGGFVGPSARVIDVMAGAASPAPSGDLSAAQNTCLTADERNAENTDLDYFFCAAPGDLMGPIFVTALEQLANGSRLIQLPE